MKPELYITAIIFILLIAKVADKLHNGAIVFRITNALLFINLIAGCIFNTSGNLFSGMYHTNYTIALEKTILNVATLIISLQSYEWLKEHKHAVEFYILLLTSLLGMFFMISSGNFLMFYLGLELAAIPLAVLANFDLGKAKSSEAAIKMIFSSAFASCTMLFGISLLYGTTGTLEFALLPKQITGNELQIFALIFVFAGFAFKLSIVPYHLWTADVYEGAPIAVTSYLSVVSKAAMVFVFISVLLPLFNNMERVRDNLMMLVIIITIIIGNLFALRQQNIKRFLAFSSISQVGYILVGLTQGGAMGFTSAVYFLVIYLFSNLGAFGVAAIVSAKTGKENINDYNGFYTANPWLGLVLTVSLFSLAGIPPTAGFFGKMFLLTAGAAKGNYILVIIAALNMIISLYYYLRIVKAIFIDKSETPVEKLKPGGSLNIAMIICVTGVIVIGFASPLYRFILSLM